MLCVVRSSLHKSVSRCHPSSVKAVVILKGSDTTSSHVKFSIQGINALARTFSELQASTKVPGWWHQPPAKACGTAAPSAGLHRGHFYFRSVRLCFSLGSTALMETSVIRLSLRDVGVFGRKGFCLGLVFCLDVLADRLHVWRQPRGRACTTRLGSQALPAPDFCLNLELQFLPFRGPVLLNKPCIVNKILASVSSSLICSIRSYKNDYQAVLGLHLFSFSHICSKAAGWIWFQKALFTWPLG